MEKYEEYENCLVHFTVVKLGYTEKKKLKNFIK